MTNKNKKQKTMPVSVEDARGHLEAAFLSARAASGAKNKFHDLEDVAKELKAAANALGGEIDGGSGNATWYPSPEPTGLLQRLEEIRNMCGDSKDGLETVMGLLRATAISEAHRNSSASEQLLDDIIGMLKGKPPKSSEVEVYSILPAHAAVGGRRFRVIGVSGDAREDGQILVDVRCNRLLSEGWKLELFTRIPVGTGEEEVFCVAAFSRW